MIHVCNTIQLYLHFVTQIQFSCGFFCRSFSGHDYTVNRINLRIPWYDHYSIKVIAAEKYYYYWSSYGDIFFLFINCSFTRDISVRRKPWFFKLKIEILTIPISIVIMETPSSLPIMADQLDHQIANHSTSGGLKQSTNSNITTTIRPTIIIYPTGRYIEWNWFSNQ